MIRFAGMILVIGSCFGLGLLTGSDKKKRLEELFELRKICNLLRGEIKYARTPFPQALMHISARIHPPFQLLFFEIAKEMEHYKGISLEEIWKKQVKRHQGEFHLKKQDLEQLLVLGECLGYLDSEMQIGTIELYLERLKSEIASSEAKIGAQMKLCQCLGIMAGVFLVIIML